MSTTSKRRRHLTLVPALPPQDIAQAAPSGETRASQMAAVARTTPRFRPVQR